MNELNDMIEPGFTAYVKNDDGTYVKEWHISEEDFSPELLEALHKEALEAAPVFPIKVMTEDISKETAYLQVSDVLGCIGLNVFAYQIKRDEEFSRMIFTISEMDVDRSTLDPHVLEFMTQGETFDLIGVAVGIPFGEIMETAKKISETYDCLVEMMFWDGERLEGKLE